MKWVSTPSILTSTALPLLPSQTIQLIQHFVQVITGQFS